MSPLGDFKAVIIEISKEKSKLNMIIFQVNETSVFSSENTLTLKQKRFWRSSILYASTGTVTLNGFGFQEASSGASGGLSFNADQNWSELLSPSPPHGQDWGPRRSLEYSEVGLACLQVLQLCQRPCTALRVRHV